MAMLLLCALCCFGAVFRPFECLKNPPDLVSEGDKVRSSSSYDSKYDYFIRHQNYLRKVLRMHHSRKLICRKRLRSTRTFHHMRKMKTSADLLCGACSDDIPLSDVPSTGMTTTPVSMNQL